MFEEFDPDDDARQNDVARRLAAYAASVSAEDEETDLDDELRAEYEEAALDDELARRLMAHAAKLRGEADEESETE